MSKTRQISIFATEEEYRDFCLVKAKLERNTNADTVRAMLKLCKKILLQNTAIAVMEKKN